MSSVIRRGALRRPALVPAASGPCCELRPQVRSAQPPLPPAPPSWEELLGRR